MSSSQAPIETNSDSLESFEQKHRIVRNFEVLLENVVTSKNSRLTTEWNILLLAKAILEGGVASN